MLLRKLWLMSPLLLMPYISNGQSVQNVSPLLQVRKDILRVIQHAQPLPEHEDTVKVYQGEEILISAEAPDETEKIDKIEMIKKSQVSTMSRGSELVALNYNAGVQAQAPFLQGSISNFNTNTTGTILIQNFEIFSDPNGPFGIDSKFGEPSFTATDMQAVPKTVKYSGLAIVSNDLKKIPDEYTLKFSHSPFKTYGSLSSPDPIKLQFVSQVNGPAPYVLHMKKIANEVALYPMMYSTQGRAEVGNVDVGKLSIAAFQWNNDGSMDGEARDAKFGINNRQHDFIGMMTLDKLVYAEWPGKFIFHTGVSYEDFNNSQSGFITDMASPSYATNDIGSTIRSTTARVEFEFPDITMGVRANFLSRSQNNAVQYDPALMNTAFDKIVKIINDQFNIAQNYAEMYDTTTVQVNGRHRTIERTFMFNSAFVNKWRNTVLDSLKNAYAPYSKMTDKDKATFLLKILNMSRNTYIDVRDSLRNVHEFTLFNPVSNNDTTIGIDPSLYLERLHDPEEYPEYLQIKGMLEAFLKDYSKGESQEIKSYKTYWIGHTEIGNTFFEPSFSWDRVEHDSYLSLGLNVSHKIGNVTIEGTALKTTAPFQRNSIDAVLKSQSFEGVNARVYSLSAMYDFDNYWISNVKVVWLNKFLSKNNSGYDALSKELDFSLSRIGDLSVIVNGSIGGASERDEPTQVYKPVDGSIDYNVKGLVSLKMWNFLLTNAINWHNGYWTNNTLSGDFVRSPQAMFWDAGLSFYYDISSTAYLEFNGGCTNIISDRLNEVFRYVIINPHTGAEEERQVNSLTIPNVEIKFVYKIPTLPF